MILPKNIVQTIKSITAREVFRQNPEVKKKLWEARFGEPAISSTRSDDLTPKRG